MTSALIIGGGIAGLAAAAHLSPHMEVCLLEDYVDNSECHHQLQTCLREEEEGDGEHYKDVLREEEHWAKVVRLLLAKDH